MTDGPPPSRGGDGGPAASREGFPGTARPRTGTIPGVAEPKTRCVRGPGEDPGTERDAGQFEPESSSGAEYGVM